MTPGVVCEDADLLVVDKPGNMVCHSPQRPGQVSLTEWVRKHGVATPRLINRLDRETSGLVVIAKNERAAKILGKQVLRRQVEKEYLAIVWGVVEEDRGIIDDPVGYAEQSLVYTKRGVDFADGLEAMTEYFVEERLREFTVLRLRPQTGRTHQLRVHLSSRGFPIVGDKVYGPDERLYLQFIREDVTDEMLAKLLLPRHALHAAYFGLRHPTSQQPVSWTAALPADLREFIEEHR